MTKVEVQRFSEETARSLPLFQELARRTEQIRMRAYNLFEQRGGQYGREMDDWIQAEREIMGEQRMQVEERPDRYEVQIALPGFDAQQIQVLVTPLELAIQAQSRSLGNADWLLGYSPFGMGEVLRRIRFDRRINPDRVSAQLDNGILRIQAEKTHPLTAAA
jgi:HSP20 family molecular chaperone IbpA